MKHLRRFISLVVALVLGTATLSALAACGGETDYGKLTVADITLTEGESKTIEPVFSIPERAEEVEYRFSGSDISISGNTVTGENAGTVTVVTAHTEHIRTNFKVTVEAADVSELVVTAPPVYVGYPARPLDVRFIGKHTDETVNYVVESAYAGKVIVENNTIRAVGSRTDFPLTSKNYGAKEGTKVKITAATSELETSFDVYVAFFEGGNAGGQSLSMESCSQSFLETYESSGGGEGAVLFIGDSFFDTRYFWTDFYTSLAKKNAFCFGVSSATTPDWELLSERLVYPLKPSDVVIHCGTNNIFDDGASASTATSDIKRLIGNLLENTEADIYYFGIEPRTGGGDSYGNNEARTCNTAIAAWCETQERVTYLDSPAFCYVNGDKSGSIDMSFYRDTVHPKQEKYALYLDALEEAGVTYGDLNAKRDIADVSGTVGQSVKETSRQIVYLGNPLTDNYVLDGKVDITAVINNPHLQFTFDGQNNPNRYLIWDSNNDGVFGLGWAKSGAYQNELQANIEPKFTFTAGSTLTIEFRIVVKNGTASFWIGDGNGNFTKKDTYANVPKVEGLRLGMEGVTGRFHDLKACTLADDPAEFAQKSGD